MALWSEANKQKSTSFTLLFVRVFVGRWRAFWPWIESFFFFLLMQSFTLYIHAALCCFPIAGKLPCFFISSKKKTFWSSFIGKIFTDAFCLPAGKEKKLPSDFSFVCFLFRVQKCANISGIFSEVPVPMTAKPNSSSEWKKVISGEKGRMFSPFSEQLLSKQGQELTGRSKKE